MRIRCSILLGVGLLFVMTAAVAEEVSSEAADDSEARALLDHVDDLFRGESSRGRMSMTVVTKHYTREMMIEAWSRGKDESLFRILAPRKEKGTATLKSGDNIWNYLPRIKRVIKVPSSMMGGSWMGSHFTNDDLVKESRMADDFTYRITFRGERDGEQVLELTLIPKEDAAVVWGRVAVVMRKADFMPLRITYEDEDLTLARTMIFTDIGEFAGRRLPARMRMVPADKPEEYTEIFYHEIEFDITLGDDVFSLRNLQQ